MMAAVVGCHADLLLHNAAADYPQLLNLGRQLGLETILAVLQILDQALTRMRQSAQVRTLLEIALVRICNLERLDDLPELISQLRQGTPAVWPPSVSGSARPPQSSVGAGPPTAAEPEPEQKKKPLDDDLRVSSPQEALPTEVLTAASADRIWKQSLGLLGDMTADHGGRYERVAISGPNQLVVSFREAYTLDKERCERPERKARIEEALSRITGQVIRVSFETIPEAADKTPAPAAASRRQRMRQLETQPLVRRAIELFEAEVTDFEEPAKGKSRGKSIEPES
jgi:DNA polymerase III gamma/tau subunit